MRALLPLPLLLNIALFTVPAMAEDEVVALEAKTEHFVFEFGKEFVHETKDSSQGVIHLLRYLGPKPEEGEVPESVQITVVEMLALNKVRVENPKQNPTQLAIGALGGIIMSHRNKLKQQGGLLAVSDVTSVVLKHLSGATQQIHMNMFKGRGFEQYSDYYVLTDGKHFLQVQGIYFPKHGSKSQQKIDVVLNSARPIPTE